MLMSGSSTSSGDVVALVFEYYFEDDVVLGNDILHFQQMRRQIVLEGDTEQGIGGSGGCDGACRARGG